MTNRLPYLFMPVIFVASAVVAQPNFEQYYYVTNAQVKAPVSIVNYEGRKSLYVEARHNYEANNTLSVYLGKTFSFTDKPQYSITPIIGALVGKFKGGSIGVNAIAEHKKLFFSTQLQFTFSRKERRENFFFAWSELGYKPNQWFFFGLSTQHTYVPNARPWVSEPGFVLGFTLGKWSFPIYSFNAISDSRYFIVGINFNGERSNRNK